MAVVLLMDEVVLIERIEKEGREKRERGNEEDKEVCVFYRFTKGAE